LPLIISSISQLSPAEYRVGLWADPQPKAHSDAATTSRNDIGVYLSFDQMLIKLLLKKMGLDVTVVEDGDEALQKVLSQPFDLIFMDIQMLNMNGYEATKIIQEKGISTPIIDF
jgi:response regulator RpfG family c-di-GMP phosphodiesterase